MREISILRLEKWGLAPILSGPNINLGIVPNLIWKMEAFPIQQYEK